MLKSITLRAFPETVGWRECLRQCRQAGYDGVEVNFDGRFSLDITSGELSELKREADALSLSITAVYSRAQWQAPITSADAARREEGARIIQRLIEIACDLSSPVVLVIPGAVDNSLLASEPEIVPYDIAYQRNGEALSLLSRDAERAGVTLGIENVANYFLQSPLEMRAFIDDIGSPALGCYFDIANCLYLGGYPEQWIRILRERIRALHVKDFRKGGGLGGFVTVFEGDVNWDAVCQVLAEIGYDGALTSEVLPAFRYYPEQLWNSVAQALRLLERDIMEKKVGSNS
ncbi:MAG: sugar phosphate isomerase/epimerase family protein [Armatimonadota bacterium]